MIRVGIVGHRYFQDADTIDFIAGECLSILKRTQVKHACVTALSAVAEGADTLFAESALALDIPLELVRPFKGYASDFTSASSRARYQKLRASAHKETKLMYDVRSDKAYLAAMNWIVERSDLLIAAWNGLPATGVGGTGDAVREAIKRRRFWIHLNTTDLSVTINNAGRI